MKATWYSDMKDQLKWTSLLYLAQKKGIRRIVHIVMLTEDPPPPRPIKLLDGPDLDSDLTWECVANHFNRAERLRDIVDLGRQRGVEIEIKLDPFTRADRRKYFDDIKDRMEQSTSKTIWFLDPDTGMSDKPSVAHISIAELTDLFKKLPSSTIWLISNTATGRRIRIGANTPATECATRYRLNWTKSTRTPRTSTNQPPSSRYKNPTRASPDTDESNPQPAKRTPVQIHRRGQHRGRR